MTNESKEIVRKVEIPFIGIREQKTTLERQDFDSWNEAMEAINAMEEDDQKAALKDFNDGRFSKIRSDAYAKLGGTGKNSIVAAVKKIVAAYKVANSDATDEEAANFVLNNVPGIREKLEAAGIDLSVKEDSDDGDSDEDNEVEAAE